MEDLEKMGKKRLAKTRIYSVACQICRQTMSFRENATQTLWSKIEKKHRQNSHPIIHCPMSEGVSEVSGASERVSAAEGLSKASSPEQANK